LRSSRSWSRWRWPRTIISGESGREEKPMDKPDTPFPRHWLYYIVLKYAVIAAAVVLALYVMARWV